MSFRSDRCQELHPRLVPGARLDIAGHLRGPVYHVTTDRGESLLVVAPDPQAARREALRRLSESVREIHE